MTRDELETALDRGRLQIKSVNGGKWYDIRRNGQTKTWKRTPSKVEIPCKVGFKECFRLAGSGWNGNGIAMFASDPTTSIRALAPEIILQRSIL